MKRETIDYCTEIWAMDKNGQRVYPYKGLRGAKAGLFSVNFTNDTSKFEGYTEEQLIGAITGGKFKRRGTIRMLPLNVKPGAERNAFAPKVFNGTPIEQFG